MLVKDAAGIPTQTLPWVEGKAGDPWREDYTLQDRIFTPTVKSLATKRLLPPLKDSLPLENISNAGLENLKIGLEDLQGFLQSYYSVSQGRQPWLS